MRHLPSSPYRHGVAWLCPQTSRSARRPVAAAMRQKKPQRWSAAAIYSSITQQVLLGGILGHRTRVTLVDQLIHSLAIHIDGLLDEVSRVDDWQRWWLDCRWVTCGCSAAALGLCDHTFFGRERLIVESAPVAGLRLDTKLTELLGRCSVHVKPIDVAEIPVGYLVGDVRFDCFH